MIEVHLAYDVMPDIDEGSYFEWMKKAIVPALKSRGIIEIRSHRNLKGRPTVLVVGLWEKPEDWDAFSNSNEWYELIEVLQSRYAVNIRIELWGPSPVIPAPLRPPK
jgi:hypothetical protein